jgi:hypothetical protein
MRSNAVSFISRVTYTSACCAVSFSGIVSIAASDDHGQSAWRSFSTVSSVTAQPSRAASCRNACPFS